MPIEPEAAPHESIEVPSQEVGEVEGARLFLAHRGEGRPTRVDLVAVRTFEPRDALLLEDAVEQSTRAAIRVGHEHVLATLGTGTPDSGTDGGGNLLGPVVQGGRQAGQVHLGKARPSREGDELMRKRTAPDHERARVAVARDGGRAGVQAATRGCGGSGQRARLRTGGLRRPGHGALRPGASRSPRRRPRRGSRHRRRQPCRTPRSGALHPRGRCSRRGCRGP